MKKLTQYLMVATFVSAFTMIGCSSTPHTLTERQMAISNPDSLPLAPASDTNVDSYAGGSLKNREQKTADAPAPAETITTIDSSAAVDLGASSSGRGR